MSNGLGAGFGALLLVAILLGLATLVGVTAVVAAVVRRRSGRIPTPLRYLPVALLVGVLGVAMFGVLALYDEAPPVAGLLLSTVFVPLAAVVGFLRRTTDLAWIDTLATATMAWSLPFLLGLGAALGLVAGIGAVDLAPTTSRQVPWVASIGGGLATVLGAVLLGTRLGGSLASARRP